MPFLSLVSYSFKAGRRASALSSPAASWDPSTDITTAIWFDASDTGSYTLSGSNVTALTDKAGNATVSITGTPNTSNTLDSKNVFTFSGSEDFTTDEVAQASSGNHWAIGVMQWNQRNDSREVHSGGHLAWLLQRVDGTATSCVGPLPRGLDAGSDGSGSRSRPSQACRIC